MTLANGLARHESFSSVVRAPNQHMGGHGFKSHWRLRFFLSVVVLNISSFNTIENVMIF